MNKLIGFPYQSVLVLGLAKSGTATAKILNDNGVKVVVNDLKASDNDKEVLDLRARGIDVLIGYHDVKLLENQQAVIKNPGIPYTNPMVEAAVSQGMPVLTEIECLSYMLDQDILGITGSNGKTTTTTLSYLMLKNSQVPVKVAGNIGKVAVEEALTLGQDEKLVLELSSFQLMGTQNFKPKIAIFLNLFEAHLDYHGTFQAYKEAKSKIFNALTENEFLIYNKDDKHVKALAEKAKAHLIPFTRSAIDEMGAYLKDGWLYFQSEAIIKLTDIRLVGEHNLENVLASVAGAKLLGATNEGIYETLTTFNGVKHRLQFVEEKEGRLIYNDSKATNILATTKALTAFDKPIRLVAGGLDRGNYFDDMIPYLKQVSGLYVYGETKDKLMDAGLKAGITDISRHETIDEAVKSAWKGSLEGDVLLLSPACASWDQFASFEDRGDRFIEIVQSL